jgi:hypothetical protein
LDGDISLTSSKKVLSFKSDLSHSSDSISHEERTSLRNDYLQLTGEASHTKRTNKFIVHYLNGLDSWISVSMQYNIPVSCLKAA